LHKCPVKAIEAFIDVRGRANIIIADIRLGTITDMKEQVDSTKRKFIRQAGTVAITAPAAAVILSAALKPALAQSASGTPTPGTIGDTIFEDRN
jgi:hypothetical protein